MFWIKDYYFDTIDWSEYNSYDIRGIATQVTRFDTAYSIAGMTPWTIEENEILILNTKCYVDSGGRPKWPMVAKDLPKRSPQEARCRYRRIRDAKLRIDRGETFRNKCHLCGQLRRGHICPNLTSNTNATRCPPVSMLSKQETMSTDKFLTSSADIAKFLNSEISCRDDLEVIHNSADSHDVSLLTYGENLMSQETISDRLSCFTSRTIVR